MAEPEVDFEPGFVMACGHRCRDVSVVEMVLGRQRFNKQIVNGLNRLPVAGRWRLLWQ